MPTTELRAKIATGRGHLCREVDEVAFCRATCGPEPGGGVSSFQVITCSRRAPMIDLRILSSPTRRCQQTVQPLAHDRFLQVEPLASLGVNAGPAQLRTLLWDGALHNVVVYTHGEAIGRLLGELVAEGLVLQPEFVTWLVEGQGRGADEGGHRRSWRCANNQRSDGGRRPQRRG